MVGPNLPFGGLACGLVLGPLPSEGLLGIVMFSIMFNFYFLVYSFSTGYLCIIIDCSYAGSANFEI